MEKLPQISAAEYEIMKIIWESSPISTNDVCERVPEDHQWSSKTVHTLLSRLTAKQVLAYEQRGRMYYYYPLISQESYLCQENHLFFLGNLFHQIVVHAQMFIGQIGRSAGVCDYLLIKWDQTLNVDDSIGLTSPNGVNGLTIGVIKPGVIVIAQFVDAQGQVDLSIFF